MYLCEICGAEFDEPVRRQAWYEPMPDGWFERLYTPPVCPFCCQPYFREEEPYGTGAGSGAGAGI